MEDYSDDDQSFDHDFHLTLARSGKVRASEPYGEMQGLLGRSMSWAQKVKQQAFDQLITPSQRYAESYRDAQGSGEPSRAPLWDPTDRILKTLDEIESDRIPGLKRALSQGLALHPEQEQDSISALDSGAKDFQTLSLREIMETMIGHGFCPHHVNALTKVYSLRILREMAKIDKRTYRGVDHAPCAEPGRNQCIAFNVDVGNYRQEHRPDCIATECYPVEVDHTALIKVLKAGGIPLIRVHDKPGKKISIGIRSRSWHHRYSTISHVWADGLGNPNGNALPVCQIRKITSLLNYDGDAKLFWMDTLCIPTDPTYHDLRQDCIDAMSSIYAGSQKVLILDKELMSISHPRSPSALCHVACSTWMCRSWTLQEAILPRECHFAFGDGVTSDRYLGVPDEYYGIDLSFYKKLQQTAKKKKDELDNNLHLFESVWNQPANRSKDDADDARNFVSVWNELASRSTTKASDLYICLASCLGFKLKQLKDYKSLDDKMRCILCSMKSLPLGLLFNAGPRSSGPDKWIPTVVSPEFIPSHGSLMYLPRGSISAFSEQSKHIRFELNGDVRVFVTEEKLAITHEFFFQADEPGFRVTPLASADDNLGSLDSTNFMIISECGYIQGSSVIRGCLLRIISETTSSQGKPTYHLEYCCPLHLNEISADIPSDPDQKVNVRELKPALLEAQMQYGEADITLKRHPQLTHQDSAPNFRKLQRQRFRSLSDRTTLFEMFVIMAWIGFYIALVYYIWLSVRLYIDWKLWNTEDGVPWMLLGVVVYVLCVILFAFPILFMIALGFAILLVPLGQIVILLVDYLLIWRSYDDDTMIDRLRRLVQTNVVALLGGTIWVFMSIGRLLRPRGSWMRQSDLENRASEFSLAPLSDVDLDSD